MAAVRFQNSISARVDLIAIGLVITVASVGVYAHELDKLKTWEKTSGTVDSVNLDKDGDRVAFIKFKDKSGNDRLFSTSLSAADDVGLVSEILLAYDPSDQGAAFIADPKHIKHSAMVGSAFGIFFISLWVFVMIVRPQGTGTAQTHCRSLP